MKGNLNMKNNHGYRSPVAQLIHQALMVCIKSRCNDQNQEKLDDFSNALLRASDDEIGE